MHNGFNLSCPDQLLFSWALLGANSDHLEMIHIIEKDSRTLAKNVNIVPSHVPCDAHYLERLTPDLLTRLKVLCKIIKVNVLVANIIIYALSQSCGISPRLLSESHELSKLVLLVDILEHDF